MYQKTSFITGLIIIVFLNSCSSSSKQVYKVAERANIGKELVTPIYDDNAKLGYTISKDNSYLFITLNTKDRVIQLTMIRNGVSIYFDKEGKKNKDYAVQYPIPEKRQAMDIETMRQMKDEGSQKAMLAQRLGNLGEKILITEDGDERIINKELNSESISVSHQMSLDGLAYTLKVPLVYIVSTTNSSSIGISINGMQRPEMGSRPSGGMRGGGGKMGGNGMRGGGYPVGSGGRPDMSQIQALQSEINIWITLDIQ